MATLEWERVDHNWVWRSSSSSDSAISAFTILRAKVPGGWLVTMQETFVRHQPDYLEIPGGLTFIPDPNHSWSQSSVGDSTAAPAGSPAVAGWELAARELLREGKKINAIKLVREHTDLGMTEAKELVESWEREQ